MMIHYLIAYLILYIADIDAEISPKEEKLIIEKLENTEDFEKVKTFFLSDDPYPQTQKIRAIFQKRDKETLLWDVKALMKADDNFSGVENYLLNLMKKFLWRG